MHAFFSVPNFSKNNNKMGQLGTAVPTSLWSELVKILPLQTEFMYCLNLEIRRTLRVGWDTRGSRCSPC